MTNLFLILLLAPFIQSGVQPTANHANERESIEVYCYLCESTVITRYLPADLHLAPNERLQWAYDSKRKGRLTLLTVTGECNGAVILWQSKKTKPEEAVRNFIKWREGR